MLSREENELLTQTGPGTATGDLLRAYWQPAALSEELPAGGAPVPLRLMSEDLVLFRDDAGRPGLLGLHCAHRAADLSYGRIEAGGLRCLYHGWLYDVHGNCLEQPGEPEVSTFKERVHHLAYPCAEVGGIIYAYMGGGEPPPMPAYDFITAPAESRSNSKVLVECNYLQGAEGNFDPTHLSFLHQIKTDDPESAQALNAEDRAPTIEVEETTYGVRIYAVRKVHGDRNYVRVTNFLLPNYCAVSGRADGYQVIWHVPVDNQTHWRFMILFTRDGPMNRDERILRNTDEIRPDYRAVRNSRNRYLQERDTMTTWSFTGLGRNFLPHDIFATETAGYVQDRSQEHLGYTDKGIIAVRQRLFGLLTKLKEGERVPGTTEDEVRQQAHDLIARSDVLLPSSVEWRDYWRDDAAQQGISTVKASR